MILFFIAIFSILIAITKLLHTWLNQEEKQKLTEWLSNSSQKKLVTPVETVKIPLNLVHSFLQTILGERELSKLSIWRSIILSFLILVGSMGIVGLLTENTLGLTSLPWVAYEDELKKIKKNLLQANKENNALDATAKLETINAIDTVLQPSYKWIYSIILLLIVISVNFGGDVISLGVSRKILNALQSTESPILITGALLLSLVIALFVMGIVILICNIVTNILFITTTMIMLEFSGIWPPLTFGLIITNLGIALFSSSPWIIGVAISSVLPSVILILVALVTLALFPLRYCLHDLLKSSVERAISHEKGPLLFASAIGTGIITVLISLIAIFR